MEAQLYSMRQLSGMCGIGRNILMRKLRGMFVLNEDNLPFKRFRDDDYFRVIYRTKEIGCYVREVPVTYATVRGVKLVQKLLADQAKVNYKSAGSL